ncbi:MAG: Fic family protein [Deltaproteobacteria bacterium]|uniref:Fic family protein n=1 Tax=Desulfobacula sp. TaxID=2593537 RepID=UPI00198DDC66|nr:Fic family protein [Candidatus Desulfobacula maris]MBL6993137.1 Fic family protein [Desulfobacula sp.]
MSRIVPAEELDLIERIISEHTRGIGISALESALASHLPKALNRRTLQRRLERLLTDKRITTQGESIALVYKRSPGVVINAEHRVIESSIGGEVQIYIPVSTEGGIIRNLVGQPLMRRNPVGYQRSFLEDYEPGVTFYLSESLRAQFHEMGRTPVGELSAGTYAREILNRLLIDLSWASSRLEGNTYNRLDTQNLIEFGQAAEGKDIHETQMILNHKAAIEMLIQEADLIGFNAFTFLNLHAILSENLLPDKDAGGRLRRRPVDIFGSVFHPVAMPQVLEDCFYLLLQKAAAIPDPFEQAFFMMVQLPYLQPFEDVNKRVSRLGANIPFIKNNLCPLSFIDVPEQAYVDGTLGVYEFNQVDLLRDVFIWAYERSCQRYLAVTKTMADPDPLRIRYRETLILVIQAIVRGLQEPSAKNIQQLTHELVPGNDREAFNKIAVDALQRLHEGSVARYRLKLSEFQSWKPIQDRWKQFFL